MDLIGKEEIATVILLFLLPFDCLIYLIWRAEQEAVEKVMCPDWGEGIE